MILHQLAFAEEVAAIANVEGQQRCGGEDRSDQRCTHAKRCFVALH